MPVKPLGPWCVLVAGSRDLSWDAHWVLIKEKLRPYDMPSAVLIHGAGSGRNGNPGCDAIAQRAGEQFRFRIYGFPALWALQKGPAGPIRNRLCIEVWLAHGPAGYRLAMLGFSTGGAGTEGILKLARSASLGRHPAPHIETIPITL